MLRLKYEAEYGAGSMSKEQKEQLLSEVQAQIAQAFDMNAFSDEFRVEAEIFGAIVEVNVVSPSRYFNISFSDFLRDCYSLMVGQELIFTELEIFDEEELEQEERKSNDGTKYH